MQSNTYWAKRSIERLTQAEKYTDVQRNRLAKIYDQSMKDIDKQIANVYKNYRSNPDITDAFKDGTLDTTKLKGLLSKHETDKYWQTMEGKGLKQYVKGNYKARITRLEQLQGQLYAKVKETADKETRLNRQTYETILNRGYQHTIYDTAKGIKDPIAFNQLDNRTIDNILDYKWSGKNYSQRIWTNTDLLADRLGEVLTRGVITGASYSKMSKEIRDAFNVSKYYADRLIRTESNHFHNEAEYQAYKEMGVEAYVFLATLDSRTSEICQEYDGKIIKLEERDEGVNYPPLHPNCRSTVFAYLGEDFMPANRRAGDDVIEYQDYNTWSGKERVELSDFDNNNEKKYNNNIDTFKNKLDKNMTELLAFSNENQVEQARLLDLDGNIIDISGGERHSVELSTKMLEPIYYGEKNSVILLHNHPGSSSFSDDDIKILVKNDTVKELYVQGDNGIIYELRRADNTLSSRNYSGINLEDLYDKHYNDLNDKIGRYRGKDSFTQRSHEVVELMAKDLRLEYKRIMPDNLELDFYLRKRSE